MTYLSVADGDGRAVFDPGASEQVSWQTPSGGVRADVPLVVFTGGADE